MPPGFKKKFGKEMNRIQGSQRLRNLPATHVKKEKYKNLHQGGDKKKQRNRQRKKKTIAEV